MGKRRRTEIARIADPAARLVTYSKRRKGLFKKASELSRLCGARVAVVVFSPAGKPCSFGDPSADEVISEYLRNGDVMLPMGLTDWKDWMQAEWDACTTEEDFESLILKYEAVRDCVRKKLKALEEDSRVQVGGRQGQGPALSAVSTEGDLFLASPENPAGAGGSFAGEPTPLSSDLGDPGFDPDEFLNLVEDGEDFLASPDDTAGGNGNLAAEPSPALSDIGETGFDPDDFFNLLEDGEGFLASPDDTADGSGNLAAEPTPALSVIGDTGFDPDHFLNLLEDGEGFLSLECSAVGGGSWGADAVLAGLEELGVRM